MPNKNCTVISLVIAGCFSIIGGQTLPPIDSGTFALPANQWIRIGDVPKDPFAREINPGRGSFFCFEPQSGELLRYGGYTPTDCNALWSFDLKKRQWTNRLPVDYTWPPPANRPCAGAWWSMANDNRRKVVWFFGGWGTAAKTHQTMMHDIWKYNPESRTFTAMNVTGGPTVPMDGLPVVYDSINDLLVAAPVARNKSADNALKGKTYVYNPNLDQWDIRTTTVMPYRVPSGPNVFVYAPCIGKSVYIENNPSGTSSSTWTYDAATNMWEKLPIPDSLCPPGRVIAGAVYDPLNQVVVIHGGAGYGTVYGGSMVGYLNAGSGVVLEDTWVLDFAATEPVWKKLNVGSPVIPLLPGQDMRRFEVMTTMGYDASNQTIVLAAPTIGVWALRYRKEAAPSLPECIVDNLPSSEPGYIQQRVFPLAPPNERLLNLPTEQWVALGGGTRIGGNELCMAYDDSTGFVLQYGGCGNGGTTFAAAYGNPLSAYDPATERWIALRWYDICGSPRPTNGCNKHNVYDSKRSIFWTRGGARQNRLPSSLLPDWTGGENYIWGYHTMQDRFEMFPVVQGYRTPNGGVVNCYDPENDRVICMENSYGLYTLGFEPSTGIWKNLGSMVAGGPGYSFACYVPSLKGMFFTYRGKPTLFDLVSDSVVYLPSSGDLPPDGDSLPLNNSKTRSASAYSPEQNKVLSICDGQASIYDISKGTWRNLGASPWGVDDKNLVYDARHKVFLFVLTKGVYAYRLNPDSNITGLTQKTVSNPDFSLRVAPNPFNPSTTITISMKNNGMPATVRLLQSDGKLVNKWILGNSKDHRIEWNAGMEKNRNAASNVYMVVVTNGTKSIKQKLILLK